VAVPPTESVRMDVPLTGSTCIGPLTMREFDMVRQ
jgi:hypothetical protein